MNYESRRRPVLAFAICIMLAVCLFANGAFAQSVTGSIYGTIEDSSGAIIPNSTITVTNVDTGETHTAQSGSSGQYTFPVLSPGSYKVTSTASGFGAVDQSGIRLAANQNVNVSFSLKAGETTSTVNIQAGTTLVDTRESQIGTTIDQARIVDLPLVGRSAYDLLVTVPGITNYSASAPIGDFNGTQFSTNGLQANFNSFYLDGSYNSSFFRGGGNIVPNPDALEEFSVLTANQDAEFGRYPGAVVNVITRSGSNEFHGVAYDFFRNTILNAKNYFLTSVTPLHYNIFGVGLGGPAIHDKLFFYLNYQGTRDHTTGNVASSAIIVPSAAERVGNFSLSAKKPTKTGCPNAEMTAPLAPATICLDPVAVAALAFVPTPINATDNPLQQSAPANTDADQGVARLDYQLNAAHKLQFTFFQSQGTQLSPTSGTTGNQIFDYSSATQFAGQSNYVLGDTWIVSPRAVNSIRVSYSLNRTISNPLPGNRLANLGSQAPEGSIMGLSSQPLFKITGYWSMGGNNSTNTNQSQLQYAVSDVLNYTRGHHTAKFGGEVIEARYQETAVFQGSTQTTFTGSFSGNALADFMEGQANSFAQNGGTYHRTHALDPSLFAQDDWHITPRLTLDLGMRWEVFYPFTGQNDTGTFIPGVQSLRFPATANEPVGLLSSGDPGVPDGVLHVSYDRFAPRIGFAYDVLGNGKLALKGAYGIYYSVDAENFAGNLEQEPFTLALTISKTTSLVDPYDGIAPYNTGTGANNGVSPFPYAVNPSNPTFVGGASLAALKANTAATPYVQEYNLTLQQQLGTNWSVQVAYVGNVGRSFYYTQDENAALYAPGATTQNASVQARRPYQPEADINEKYPGNNTSYNSLQATVTKRMSHGFSLSASYVWSKILDIVDVDPGGGSAYTLANENDPALDRAVSTNNVPQRFVASYLYALPNVHRFGLLGKEALDGWQINGITTLQSGQPFNVLSNTDTNFDSIATDRPNITGNPSLGSGRSRIQKATEFFNTADFTVPVAPTLYGNSPRDPISGPGYVDTDIAAFKRFALYGHSDLLFRGEVFNLFNNVNLGQPNGTLGNAKFGTITAASAPRIVQFALKLEF